MIWVENSWNGHETDNYSHLDAWKLPNYCFCYYRLFLSMFLTPLSTEGWKCDFLFATMFLPFRRMEIVYKMGWHTAARAWIKGRRTDQAVHPLIPFGWSMCDIWGCISWPENHKTHITHLDRFRSTGRRRRPVERIVATKNCAISGPPT